MSICIHFSKLCHNETVFSRISKLKSPVSSEQHWIEHPRKLSQIKYTISN